MHSENVGDRKISFEKSAMTVSLKLGGVGAGGGSGGGVEVAKLDEAFISNVPVSADTPSLLQEAEPRCHTTPPPHRHTHSHTHITLVHSPPKL